MKHRFTRSQIIRGGAAMATLLIVPQTGWADDAEITPDMILNDPDTPTFGNLHGDLTIVAFLDYNCPFCKASSAHLERVVKTDGKIRLVYKDWPVLEPTSIIGAKLALAAKYQDQSVAAHAALMKIPGTGVSSDAMLAALRKTPIDMNRLVADVDAHNEDITKLIERNLAMADYIGFQGTPGFIIGPYKVNQALDYDAFKKAVADGRALLKEKKK